MLSASIHDLLEPVASAVKVICEGILDQLAFLSMQMKC